MTALVSPCPADLIETWQADPRAIDDRRRYEKPSGFEGFRGFVRCGAENSDDSYEIKTRQTGAGAARRAAVLGKTGRDDALLAQQDAGEAVPLSDADRGGLTIGHKHNPVAVVAVLVCAWMPRLVATVLAGMEQEYERADRAWQAERGVQVELLELVGSAAASARELLEKLQIHPS